MIFARSTSTTAGRAGIGSVLVDLGVAFQVNLAIALGELIEYGLLNICRGELVIGSMRYWSGLFLGGSCCGFGFVRLSGRKFVTAFVDTVRGSICSVQGQPTGGRNDRASAKCASYLISFILLPIWSRTFSSVK